MTKQISQVAQVAKIIKADLKAMGIKATAKSSSYSMGDSVRVSIENVAPKLAAELKAKYACYQYGHFNGMEDIYEQSNSRDDIPQTKHLFINFLFSADVEALALAHCETKHAMFNKESEHYQQSADYDRQRVLSDTLYSADDDNSFWQTVKNQQKKRSVELDRLHKEVGILDAAPVDKITVKSNPSKNGVEIFFPATEIPSLAVRTDLKKNGFRFSRFNQCWYSKASMATQTYADSLVNP